MSYPHNDAMAIMVDIDRFTVKRILVDSGSVCNVLTWEAAIELQVGMAKLQKVTTLVGIKDKPVKVEGSV